MSATTTTHPFIVHASCLDLLNSGELSLVQIGTVAAIARIASADCDRVPSFDGPSIDDAVAAYMPTLRRRVGLDAPVTRPEHDDDAQYAKVREAGLHYEPTAEDWADYMAFCEEMEEREHAAWVEAREREAERMADDEPSEQDREWWASIGDVLLAECDHAAA